MHALVGKGHSEITLATHNDLCTESLGKENTIVSQASKPDNTDFAALANLVSVERAKAGDTSTQPTETSSSQRLCGVNLDGSCLQLTWKQRPHSPSFRGGGKRIVGGT